MSATIRSILCSFISGKCHPGSLISKRGCLFCSNVSPSPPKPPTCTASIDAADQSSVKRPTVSAAAGLMDGQRSPPISSLAPSAQACLSATEVGERGKGKDFSDFASLNVEDDSSDFDKFKALARDNAAADDLPRMDEYIAAFESWALKHDIVYKSMEERLHRFEVLKDRLKCIGKTKVIVNYGTEEFGRKVRCSFGHMWPSVDKIYRRFSGADTLADEIDEQDSEESENHNPKVENDSSDLDKFVELARARAAADDLTRIDEYIAGFGCWILKHNKVYKSMEEKLHRFEVFKATFKYIEKKNKEIVGYWLGLNDFADLTHEEFCRIYLPMRHNPPLKLRRLR